MPSIDIAVINKLGLHARASAKLTQLASRFRSEIHIARGTRRVNAKSIMGVMMLAAGIGTKVTVDAEGEDAQEALDQIRALFEQKFGEAE
ncbi:MAG: phosphocarrier protein HPr [Bordetella sp. SCN 67-23]|uniref:Phosphocarrier protein n=2 Tax=Pigmentiphaga TaxID=152267 RepID=A0A4Q7NI80_9BURK|nr:MULTISPECIES: HPr family phosphocarrier protein [Pigmentiphaga]MBN9473457.1 HPr family phosphocarrier protein [Burkholderiales bacterium]ODS67922.1 MAG: phosphocarrier protein HPr [Bordetella sp. SCN 67-23]ODU78162.1 MAG: phosphocarrier protein HPr [Bordetella sp. SCN 68-11]OJW86412.1 MAG: phosphocarrier protein HPr [Burkholderiales bacterium 67-32]MDH2238170.1 HPr family phosphocarrier protein [Pigmentiphaga sp. GD03639]